MADSPSPVVLALVRDLMFVSKITSTAQAVGIAVQVIRDPAGLADQPGQLLLLDLNLPGAIDAAMKWTNQTGARAIGFVSHMDADTISKARHDGLDRILARSAFAQMLPDILRNAQGTAAGPPGAE